MNNLFSHISLISFSGRPSFEECGMWHREGKLEYSGDKEIS